MKSEIPHKLRKEPEVKEQKNTRILVTGANGLLGAHVVRCLLSKGYRVLVMVRKGSNLKALEGLDVDWFEGNVTDKEDVVRAVIQSDFVIHAAARTTQSPSSLEAYREVNINSTKYLVEAAEKYRIERMVYVSTANCFGNGSKEHPGNENTPFIPWLKKSGYAYSKLLAQQLVLESVRQKKVNAVIVNPTFLIGENDVKPSSGEVFLHVVNKRLVFYPPGGKNFVDAAMAAEGVVAALEKGRSGECYLLTGENLSYREFFEKVMSVTQQRSVFVPIPSWLLKCAGFAGDLLEKYLKLPVRLTRVNARMLSLGNYFTSEKAAKELGFRELPVQESVEKAILWFQKNNYL